MRITTCLALILLLPALVFPAQKIAPKDLPELYRGWLDLVAYHIQPVERDVFLQLTNDRDRDLFIETFWKQRDPTPGTPENEYREEILKRFKYANETLGRMTTREGWRTDMGRIYMILGQPSSIERFDATLGVVPCQSWSYYGDARKDLPPQFVLLFYQRGGVGEYKLYDPVSDGPASLIRNQRDLGDPFDYEALYEKIRDLYPTLAELSITRIPGEYNFDLSPSTRNAILLANILTSPKKDVNPSYASHFLNYKGVVSTEYLTNYVESYASTALIEDPQTGLRFLHFSMVPADVNVDTYEPKNQFYCSFRADVSLRSGEDIVFQYSREFPLYFPQSDWGRIKGNGLAIEDSFPVIEGKFKLNVLLTNTVGKQFSVLERDLVIPPVKASPSIDGPFLGYRFETLPRDVHYPFKVDDRKLVTDPKMTYARSDEIAVLFSVLNATGDLFQNGEARIVVQGLREANPVRKSYSLRLSGHPAGKVLPIAQTIPASDLEPDYYEIHVSLIDAGGAVIDEKTATFVVSPSPALGHPIANARGLALSNQFLYRYMLAQQAEKMGRPEAARALYEQAYQLNPDYGEGVVRYGSFLNKIGAYEEALKVAEHLRADEKRKFPYQVIKGLALMGQEKNEAALAELLLANRIYNSDTNVLNALGTCYERLGRKTDALAAFRASLTLDPGQTAIKKRVEVLEK